MTLAYRLAVAEDMPMVVASWADSFRTSRSAGLIAMEDWLSVMTVQIRKILARPGTSVHVACHPGEDDHRADLYGWIAVHRGHLVTATEQDGNRHGRRLVENHVPLVLYVYTKAPYRRMGIARGLFRAADVGPRWDYACRTSVVSKLAEKIPPESEWLHLAARFPPKNEPRRS